MKASELRSGTPEAWWLTITAKVANCAQQRVLLRKCVCDVVPTVCLHALLSSTDCCLLFPLVWESVPV